MRLIAVLGYSAGRGDGLHEVCADRLHHAEQVAEDGDTVLFSGWARRGTSHGEAELMRRAWRRPNVELVSDTTARNTRENALSVAATAERLAADEVVVVTSRWHAPRARMLVRAALPGVSVFASSPPGRRPASLVAREVVCLAAFPYQLAGVRRRSGRARRTTARTG